MDRLTWTDVRRLTVGHIVDRDTGRRTSRVDRVQCGWLRPLRSSPGVTGQWALIARTTATTTTTAPTRAEQRTSLSRVLAYLSSHSLHRSLHHVYGYHLTLAYMTLSICPSSSSVHNVPDLHPHLSLACPPYHMLSCSKVPSAMTASRASVEPNQNTSCACGHPLHLLAFLVRPGEAFGPRTTCTACGRQHVRRVAQTEEQLVAAPFALFHRVDRPGVRGATGRPTRYYFDRCTYRAFGEEERWETWREASRSAMQAHANKRIDIENKRLEDMYKASMVAAPEARPRSTGLQRHPQQAQYRSCFLNGASACADAAHRSLRSAAPSHAAHLGGAVHNEAYAARWLLVLDRRPSPEARAGEGQHQQPPPPPPPTTVVDESRQRPAPSEPGVHLRASRAVAAVAVHNGQRPPAAPASPTASHQSAREQWDGPAPAAVPPPSYYDHLEQLPRSSQADAPPNKDEHSSETRQRIQRAERVQRCATAERVAQDASSTTCHRCDRASTQPLLQCTVGLEARDTAVAAPDGPVYVCQSTTALLAPAAHSHVCLRTHAVPSVLTCVCAFACRWQGRALHCVPCGLVSSVLYTLPGAARLSSHFPAPCFSCVVHVCSCYVISVWRSCGSTAHSWRRGAVPRAWARAHASAASRCAADRSVCKHVRQP